MAGYSIEEVIFEYRILRQTVIQILEKEVKLSGKEREIITDLCEQAVNDAAAEFSDHQRIVSEQFTAVLTHDLRNPMSAAKTSAELVLRRSTQPDCLKYAGRIVDNINRMDTMIQDLLDSGRIRAGEVLAAKMVECHPAEVAAEVISEFTSAHGDRFFLSSDNDLQVWWSPDLIRRAFENLIGNAIKYGDAHSPIHVSLHQNENHSMVRITVHNEGNPIPESELKGLFKIYGRLKSAESSSKKGWGLGLTLVSGVAKSHGGKVSVESLKGKGTSFTMTLPRDCREKENLKEDDKKLPPLQREKTKKIASRIGKRRPGPALQ
jgi:signal transduction histidine kinase